MASILQDVCTCGHGWRDHEAYEPPYVCGHGESADEPDGDCDCMDYDQAVALVSERTLAQLRAARDVVEEARRIRAVFGKDGPLHRAIAAYDTQRG